ncbi:sensor histidine kinase [Rhodococcus rhodnii]|uniref:Receptor-like histidine kinase of 2 component n=2 Tax=Rhodococcus rhodnii TaxID=38312 RepID=R7WMS0_9NOCA|nr:receptor-like histidine kinase of 2 component [Rhodococcus rhodnii LMG 5362]TXG89486.1 sensor histidine kinase [Rhodococcus rhodnii]
MGGGGRAGGDGAPVNDGVRSWFDPVRHGWLWAIPWTPFLLFPLGGILASEAAAPLRWLSVAATVAFGVLFVVAFRDSEELDRGFGRAEVIVVAALCALAAVSIPVLGVSSLGFLPFLVSYAMFAVGLRAGLITGALALALSIVVPPLSGASGAGQWLFTLILLPVVVIGATTHIFESGAVQRRNLEERLAIAADRNRVARDIHDILGHGLTVIAVKSELAQTMVDLDPERARTEMREVHELARSALADVRDTVAELREPTVAASLDAARTMLSAAGIELGVHAEHVSPQHEPVFAWIVREAATNVVRHSRAGRCTVAVEPGHITIEDDGIGLGESRHGNGLRGIVERAREIGGSVDLAESPTGGARIEVTVP